MEAAAVELMNGFDETNDWNECGILKAYKKAFQFVHPFNGFHCCSGCEWL